MAETTRDRILDAVEGIICEQGISALTIEGVALEAGLSKGGVLYNYRTKDALIHSMMDRVSEKFRVDIAEGRERYLAEGQSNPTLRACIDSFQTVDEKRLLHNIVSISLEHPEYMEKFRKSCCEIETAIVDEAEDKKLAVLVNLALGGLHFRRTLDIEAKSKEEISGILDHLVELLENKYFPQDTTN
ncbi:TetR/AcrR family transcriptional regulator [Flexibacterium corallicola]|uniref:TetR/AcrR family transcriptional regulator n=1 Tax=Flexibacterium corallicola TaxID=3037259 RepID=UPI00286F0A89|nr:TetR/AcrR family transcriptional regulator [Pseudovibrio sp. M1P-2-3]